MLFVTLPAAPTTRTEPDSDRRRSDSRKQRGQTIEVDRIGDFARIQSAPGAVTEVPDPSGDAGRALKLTVDDGDVYPVTPTSDPRAQLLSPAVIDPGEEFWWSARFYLPANFPRWVPGWLTVLEGPYGPPFDGTPPFHLEIHGNTLRWQRNETYDWDIPWRMPIKRGRWVEIVLHQRFAVHGFVEMWVDGRRVTFFGPGSHNPSGLAPTRRLQMKTRDGSNNGGANFNAILNYRKAGMFSSVTLLHGPLLIGPSRAAVEG